MIDQAIERLEYLCDTIPPLLHAIGEPEFSQREQPEKWSRKEIIGHLIDSAVNNHQRFMRAQFEETPAITYDQDNWNAFSFYGQRDGKDIIDFWAMYHRQLLELIKRIPAASLQRTCQTEDVHTLDFLINDYVEHQEHHLKQVVKY